MTDLEAAHAKLGDDGRVVIPAPMRKALDLKPGDTVVIESDADGLRLRGFDRVLRETQEYFRQFVPPGVSVVDELLAERRTEAAREKAELAGRTGDRGEA